jgi:hypothetical protein
MALQDYLSQNYHIIVFYGARSEYERQYACPREGP